ncbi:MAG: hypothetical protein KGD74_06415 [Candidatus Lokiarchaeota archaeon]|nr:hypothetical protein [Candidatus Lokiarchaeota archaeon]
MILSVIRIRWDVSKGHAKCGLIIGIIGTLRLIPGLIHSFVSLIKFISA